ncbi:chaplin [Streptomyces sp. AF1A]|jgi:hypothetical protein|uniref:chaplin n=1 Tax=Streptomyces sp. AF1A TaxID=3394350 RepID=UPI0039BD0BFF
MKRVTRNGVIALAAASGAMAVVGPAFADSAADGAADGAPGLVSGNTVQLPVHVPVDICGNTVNAVGLLNPAMGNNCANEDDGAVTSDEPAGGGATAVGGAKDSPGVVSGNDIQLPVHLPVNVSGNTANVVGIGNPVFGNRSVDTDRPAPPTKVAPPVRSEPPAAPEPQAPPVRSAPVPAVSTRVAQPPVGTLAHTGTDGTLLAAATSAVSLIGGTALYRRFRSGAARRKP